MDEMAKNCHKTLKGTMIGVRHLQYVHITEQIYVNSEQALQNNLNIWWDEFEKHGTAIYMNKTEVVKVSKDKKQRNAYIISKMKKLYNRKILNTLEQH